MITNLIKLAANALKYAKAECIDAIDRLKKPIEYKSDPLIFEWATVELLGHRQIEGEVYQIGNGSTKLYRVVSPEGTTIVSPRSLYAMTGRKRVSATEAVDALGKEVANGFAKGFREYEVVEPRDSSDIDDAAW